MKRFLSTLLVMLMIVSMMPVTAHAATEWAYVKWANGTRTTYSTFPDAWQAATSSGDNNTVGLLNNWDGGRFVVSEGKTVTVELNGYVVTRDLADSKSDGEVFYVGEKARLNIYGGNQDDLTYGSGNSHRVNVYVANADRYDYTRRIETLYGGIINGGNSDNGGGGIHMKENAKVYLYNVTIAGNKADRSGANYGDGGGIEMNNKYGYLYMQDSQIIYNAARYDGGGVHIDSDYCRIEMVRSRIDHNVADDNGGGIYVEGDKCILKGDAQQIKDPDAAISAYGINDWTGAYNYFPPVNEIGSSISYNCVFDAEDGGGGIYVDNEKSLIEGINIFGNIATDDAGSGNGDGGGIYLDQEGITVRSCNILRNKADELGGGIHNRGDDNIMDHDDNTIDSCTIYKNLAWEADGAGGGIYLYRYCDLNVTGTLIVRGNVSKTYGEDNIYLSADTVDVRAYLIPALTPGADVHVRLSYEFLYSGVNQISRDPGTYDIQLFGYDNSGGEHISWNSAWHDRYLRVAKGVKPERTGRMAFEPPYGERTQVVADGDDGSYNGYKIIKGVVSYPSFPDETSDIENVFYYSDGFFAGDTNTYNPQLATLSMALAGAAGYSNEYGKDDKEGGLTSDYLDKSQNFRQFVSDIGCADKDIYVNDFNTQKPDADTIGVGIASKQIFDDKTLVIIGVRGMGYEKEWVSNMSLGPKGESAGWSSAANQVMAELKNYLSRKGIDGSSEKTIFWIAGYSRAGATSNLTAKRIVDAFDNQGTHTFAYPIEAPKGGVSSEKVEGNNYNCIHNVINQNDIVPWVGTTEMGFIRYGVDHYVPGSSDLKKNTTDGEEGKYPGNNIPEDNSPWDVENTLTPGYTDQKKKLLSQLTAVNQDIIFDDYYHQATVNYILGGIGLEDMITETTAHEYEDQIGTTEHLVDFFFKKLQEYAFKYELDGDLVDDYYKNNPRRYFSEYKINGEKTFQQAAASIAGILFGKSKEDSEGLIGCFSALMDRIDRSDMLRIYGNIDEDDIDDLEDEIEFIWDKLINLSDTDKAKGYHSIKDYLTDDEYKELSAGFKSLLFPILCFAGVDYDSWDQDILGSMAYNVSRIIANHYPEVTHAWLRSYDYLYADDITPIVMADDAKTGPSGVAVEITYANGDSRIITPDSGDTIEVHVDDTVRLVSANRNYRDTGEAFYYQFTTGQDHTVHAFFDSFRFYDMIKTNATNGVFTMNIIAAHDGIKMDPVQLSFKFANASILVVPEAWDSTSEDYSYKAVPLEIGDEYELSWIDPDIEDEEFRFKKWEAYKYTDESTAADERIPEDQYIDCFGWDFDPTKATTTVENHSGVSAKLVPVYDRIITDMPIAFTGGTDLPRNAKWLHDPVENAEYPIYWRYDETAKKYIAEFSIDIPENRSLAENVNVTFEPLTAANESLTNTEDPEPTPEETMTEPEETPEEIVETPEATEETVTESEETPAETEETPAETEEALSETEDSLTDGEGAILPEAKNALPEVSEALAETEEIPAETAETVTESEETPAEIEETPAATEETLTEPEETPAEIEETPAATEETLTDPEETPEVIEETPVPTEETVTEPEETPDETEIAPAETDEPLSNTEEALTESSNDLNAANYKVKDPKLINVSFANQRALFEVEFTPVEGEEGGAITGFTKIETRDLNLGESIETLYIDLNGLTSVTAPDQRNMDFVKWWNDSTSRSIETSAFKDVTEILVYYRPIVNEIDVTLEDIPAGSHVLPDMDSTTVKITNTWRIDTAEMTWRTTDTFAQYDTSYTARITVKKADMMGTNMDAPDSESVKLAGAFTLAENMTVNVKDQEGKPAVLTNYIFSETADEIILDLVFSTQKQKIVRFAESSVTVSMADIHTYGIGYGLPEEINAYLESGFMVSVPVDWHRTQEHVDYENDKITQVTHWEGEYTGDTYTIEEGAMPILTETITPIDRPNSPHAIPESGDYEGAQTITLMADEGAEIYYRVVEYIDGVDNPLRDPWFYLSNPPDQYTLKYTEPIKLNKYIANDYYLFAYAKYPGSDYSSSPVQYRYKLTKPENTKILEAKDPKIAEDGNIKCWYTYTTKADGSVIPVNYYADEECTQLLDYKNDVLVPSFIRTTHAAAEGDAIHSVIRQGGAESIIYKGFENLGVQAIGNDGKSARVLTVLDARIIDAATDYGYLFDKDASLLNYESAQYKFSAKNTTNSLYSGDDYNYVTAKIANMYLDPEMKVCFYVKLENGADYIYTDAVSCVPIFDRSESTDSATDNITADEVEIKPEFKTRSLLLSGQIGVNFFMSLPEIEGVDYNDSYMTFKISGRGTITDRDDYDPEFKDKSGKGYYGFTCYVNSIQMADTITATFHYGDEKTVSLDYSVAQYIAYFDDHHTGFPNATLNLIKAIGDYGHYAQPFLSEENDWIIGKDYAEMTHYYAKSYDYDAIKNAMESYVFVKNIAGTKVKNATYRLNLESETMVDVFMTVEDGAELTASTTFKGKTFTAEKQSDGRYRIRVTGISAHLLGDTINITGNCGGEFTITVSALAYARGVLNSSNFNANAKNAMAALYQYYDAVLKYRNQ